MDRLAICVDKEQIVWMIGKYVTIDKRSKGGYLEFFYVDDIQDRPRGYTLYGKGFAISDLFIKINSTTTLFIEDKDIDCISESSEEDFYKAFDEYVRLIKKELGNTKSYNVLRDQFKFKKSLMAATIELTDKDILSNKVLKSLKSE